MLARQDRTISPGLIDDIIDDLYQQVFKYRGEREAICPGR